jgi:short subunit fatty acids transporter
MTTEGTPQLLSFTMQRSGILIDGDVVPVKVLVKT